MTTTNTALRVVAVLEAFKGIISLTVALGLHALAGRDLRHIAETIIGHLHLNPASHYPSTFIKAASSLTEGQILLVTIAAFAYSAIRLVEAYGLWRGLVWTEWFALISGAIYLPFELYEVVVHHSALSVVVLLVNALIVWYMARMLIGKKKAERQASADIKSATPQ